MTFRRWKDLMVATALLMLTVAFWYTEVLKPSTVRGIAGGNFDLFTYFYQNHHFAAESIKAGQLPLWMPYHGCGRPFLATLVAVFYPPNFLYLVLPTHVAMGVISMLHIFLAGLFMYLFCLTMKTTRFAASFGALVFMFSFAIVGRIWWMSILNSAVWIPLVFLCCEKLFQNLRPTWAIGLGAAVALQMLSGGLQLVIYTLYALALYCLFRLVLTYLEERRSRKVFISFLYLCLSAAVALSLSAIQFIPTVELWMLSSRGPGGLSLNRIDVIQRVGVNPIVDFLKAVIDPGPAQIGFGEYIGITPLIAAVLFPLGTKRKAHGVFFLLVAVIAVVLSFGSFTPLFRAYHHLPTGNWFRVPQRFLYLYGFSMPILCAMGLDALMEGARKTGKFLIPVNVSFLVLNIACLAAIVLLSPTAKVLGGITLAAVWGATVLERKTRTSIIWIPILAIVIFDLWNKSGWTWEHPQANPEAFLEHADVAEFLNKHGSQWRAYAHLSSFRVMSPMFLLFGNMHNVFLIGDYEPLSLGRYGKLCNFFEARGTGFVGQPFIGSFRLNNTTPNLRLMNLLSTRYVITVASDRSFFASSGTAGEGRNQDASRQFKPVFNNGEIIIYENPDALPRAYVVGEAKVFQDERQVLEALANGSLDVRREVALEGTVHPVPSHEREAELSSAEVELRAYRANEVLVDIRTPADGWLVLTDCFYPGWKAFVDGEEERIYRANYLFRAVPVKEGHHLVRFVYKPLSFFIGAGWSVSTLLVLGGCLTARLWSRHGQRLPGKPEIGSSSPSHQSNRRNG